jgi:hypothetical protein
MHLSLKVDLLKTPQIKAKMPMKTRSTSTSRKRFQEYYVTDMNYTMKLEKERTAGSTTLQI